MWYLQGLFLFLLLKMQAESAAAFPQTTGTKNYFAGMEKVTGSQAVELCRRRSMKLASIRNQRENDDIERFLLQKGLFNGFLTSGKELSYGEAYSWLDGKIIDFFSWRKGEPNGYDETEDCIVVIITNGTLKWDDSRCNYPEFYICESTDEETSIDEDVSCTSRKSSERKYYLGTEKMSYYEAILYCEKMFMQLATVKNAEENSEIYELMLLRGAKTEFWISADKRKYSNSWQWMNGSKLEYFNWIQGIQGKPSFDEPRCLAVLKRDQDVNWKDAPCDDKFYAICEKIDFHRKIQVNRESLPLEKRKSYQNPSETSNPPEFSKELLFMRLRY